ncbi:ABC-F family ATP-binding cassette domain-containing protein [Gemmatimonadota bacterium DH-20]|uniref:ABC-F family ATP-binding cassette domain-containing protein n=1 Tax=Gaopeijia maritima TaxID=3119007 RepID=A0ABU9E9H9_9BACT
MSEPFVIAENLGVELPDGRPLFDRLSLSVGEGRTGLVGANGVGKSVLLDVLVGVRVPERGRVVRQGRIAYVAQRRSATPETPDETVAARLGVADRLEALARVLAGGSDPADYERVGVDGWDLEERTRAALDRVGLRPLGLDARMADLSGGEAARVTLVGALLGEPDLLVLDEPTNDLDAPSRAALLTLLDGWRGGVLAVSHDRGFLRRVDRILELGPEGLREFGGAWDAWREARSRELEAAEAELASARAARRKAASDAAQARERQERRTARGVRTRGDGSQPKTVLNARKARSQATSARLDRVQSDGVAEASSRVSEAAARVHRAAAPRVEIGASGLPAGREVLRAEALAWTPPGRERALFEDLSLVVRGPERLAVEGPNGSGKSTLLALLAGRRAPDRGSVRRGLPDDRIAWLDQQTRTLDGHDTVLSSFRAAHPAMEESWARHTLARFLFLDDAVHTPVPALSGGERVRAALAGLLGGERTPQLLFLDEPTNHLDLPGLEAVEAALAEWDGALVVVSHDADFLDAIGVERRVVLGGAP